MAIVSRYSFALLGLILLHEIAMAGSLAGKVSGKDDNQPLAGVNVVLQGTVRGTTTNAQGEFFMTNIPPGVYAVVFSLVGYQREMLTGVLIDDENDKLLSVLMRESPLQTEQIVVTANKREQSLIEVPVSISVVDATEIQRRNTLTIDEALRYVPGVNMTGTQINIRGSSGYSLGAGSRVLMLLDGIPFIAGDTGELIFESIPAGQVDRIEVVKGASSALYGSNALGGVINIITKPIGEKPLTHIRTYGGLYSEPSFDQWKWSDKRRYFNGQSLTLTRKLGDLGFSVFLSRQFDDGFRQNDYRRRYNLYIKAREDFSESSSLTLNVGALHQESGQFLYWRSLDSALIPPLRHMTDNLKSTRTYVNGLFNTVLSERMLLTLKALWTHSTWGFQQMGDLTRTESLNDGFRVEASSVLMLDDMHTLTFGVDGNIDLIRGAMFGQRTIGGLALFAQDEVRFSDQFTLTLGARSDFQSVGLTSGNSDINPKIALTHRPWEGTTFRASFGTGFRVPSIPEAFIAAGGGLVKGVPNTDLKPEISLSFELGASHTLGTLGTLDVAAFRSDFNNLIEPGLLISGQNLFVQWRNVVKARVQGYETSVKLAFFDGDLHTNVGYTYTFPEDRIAKTVLKYRPRHILYTNAQAQVGWFSLGVDFRYVSRVERIDQELVDAGIVPDGDERDAIYVADARVGGEFSISDIAFSAGLHVKNIFQHNYVELLGNMMPPRTFVLTLEARL
ncbi:MAG: TonB-dependent receptor [Ignavibacteriae bacterium]|nr:TonB-dependent receptor [Ignavibacteriota bacterium]